MVDVRDGNKFCCSGLFVELDSALDSQRTSVW
jgi:hypothetical protein